MPSHHDPDHENDAQERRPDYQQFLRPLIWTVGYSVLHVTVLLRGIMAYQQPELLTSWHFWSVNLFIATVCAGLMTAGWGRKVNWPR